VDMIHGTVAGSLFVDSVLVTPEVALDSIEAWNSGTILIKDSVLIDAGLTVDGDVFVINGHRYYGIDASGADTFWIYDDGDTTRFNSDNPIKVGNASLVVETDGDVVATQDFYVLGDAFFDNDIDVDGDVYATKVYTSDSIIVGTSMFVTRNVEIDRDLRVNDDAYINDTLFVGGNAYFDKDVVIDDDLRVNDSLIVYGDGVFHNDIEIGDSLFVNEYVRIAGDVWIGDNLDIMDSLMIWGPIVIAGAQPLFADTIYTSLIRGDVAGSLFVRDYLVAPEVVIDSIEAWHGSSILMKDDFVLDADLTVNGDGIFQSDIYVTDTLHGNVIDADSGLFNTTVTNDLIVGDSSFFGNISYFSGVALFDSSVVFNDNILIDNGNRIVGVDATQADSFWIYDDGDTTRFNSDNPIKVGNASLIVETDGDVVATEDLTIGGVLYGDGSGLTSVPSNSHTHFSLDSRDGTPDSILYITDAGKVGIGTKSAAEELEI
ncbi:MAG: hypothetical protein ACP5G4_10925, partial [bacterium]